MQHLFLLLLAIILGIARASGQPLEYLDSSQQSTSFRGMAVVDENVIWVSGSRGTIGRSTDGGRHWNWVSPAGFERRDFRDIVAFDSMYALAMAVDSPGIIIKTTDGGQSWKTVFEKHRKGMFLDDLAFRNGSRGIALGDPIDGRFYIIYTTDSAETWTELLGPIAEAGEACFAASGSNVLVFDEPVNGANAVFVTGGSISRLHALDFRNGTISSPIRLPLQQGTGTTGANSICANKSQIWIGGGDFSSPQRGDSTVAAIDFAGAMLMRPESTMPYASCIQTTTDNRVIACGTAGISLSTTLIMGQAPSFSLVAPDPFHVLRVAPSKQKAWLAGPKGRIASITWQ